MSKILLAEDDPTMVSLLKTFLKMEGFETAVLNEQDSILDSIYQENPDIILMDVHLTQGNGLELLQQIRAEDKIQHVIVIMQSGMNLVRECLAAGADAFLLKPYLPDTLVSTIKNGLANQKSRI